MLTIKQAREAGASRGRWMAEAIVLEGGDPDICSAPDWLGGEWPEESMLELLDLDGTEDCWDVNDVVNAYEDAANDAFADVMSQYTKE